MEGLGRLFDLSCGVAPVDLQTAQTGKRVSLRHAAGVSIVLFKGAGTAADDPTVTLKEHTASSGGTSQNLAVIDHYHLKAETALDGDETWETVTQSAAATIADPGGDGTSAESQQIVVIEVDATSLSDGYAYVSLDVADVGGNAQLGAVLYILRDLASQRAPDKMHAPLS
ncbi:hypothetical protein GCM10022254_09890 [Actinomadura meridiana]|uniref:Uncharacterized protein n=1 Tax=Actinomadura meridiana TaxID=559626 RepID=A0ABP8BTY4_9ACTN